MGKQLLVLGVIISLIGFVLSYGIHIPFFGKLPGDILIKKENSVFYFPLSTCLVISVFIAILARLFNK